MQPAQQRKASLQMDYRHFHFGVYHTYVAVHLLSVFLFFLGLLCTRKTLISSLEKGDDNLMGHRAAKGFYGPITFDEVLDAMNESHPLHGLLVEGKEWASHAFGSAPHNYCWLKHKRPTEYGLPSLLRVMDYNVAVQVFFRAAVLIAVGFRFFFSVVWTKYLLTRLRNGLRLKAVSVIYTVSDIFWQVFAMLVFCVQKDQDQSLHWLMYLHIPLFGFFFVVHSMIYIVFSSVAFKRTIVHYVQLGSVLLLSYILPFIYQSHLPFLEPRGKPCYVEVPIQQALLEYSAILCVFILLSTQYWDIRHLFGIVTVSSKEYQSYFVSAEGYSPYIASQIKQILCVPVKLSTIN